MKDNYSTQEIADILGVSVRTVQNHLSDLRESLRKGKKYKYSVIKAISVVYDYELNETKRNKTKTYAEYDHIEYFTEEEYQLFHKRLVEYPLLLEKVNILLKELDWHKKDKEWHKEQQKKLIESIKERNFIEAKEKRLDK